jgi:hypothetical protein
LVTSIDDAPLGVFVALDSGFDSSSVELKALLPSTNLADARAALAVRLATRGDLLKFWAGDTAVADPSRLIESFQQRLSISCMRPTIFVYERQEYPIAIDIDLEFQEVVKQVALVLPGSISPDALEITFLNSLVDMTMTISDLEPDESTRLVIELKEPADTCQPVISRVASPGPVQSTSPISQPPALPPGTTSRVQTSCIATDPVAAGERPQPPRPASAAPQPALPVAASPPAAASNPVCAASNPVAAPAIVPEPAKRTIQIALCLGLIPQFGRFSVANHATVGDVESDVRKKWGLDEIDIEFSVMNNSVGSDRRIQNSKKISEINFEKCVLAVRRAGSPDDYGDEGPVGEPADEVEHTLIHQTVPRVLPPPEVSANETTINFKVPQRGDDCVFPLGFPKGQTVKDARRRVAEVLGVTIDAITLLFAGKSFRDQFVLERLRVGKQPVIVYVRDTAEIILVTARAMRTPS